MFDLVMCSQARLANTQACVYALKLRFVCRYFLNFERKGLPKCADSFQCRSSQSGFVAIS